MKEKSVKVDGYKIRYLVDGRSKKNLLLIHGLGALGSSDGADPHSIVGGGWAAMPP